MAEHDVGAVLVLDGGRSIGTFSERDYARYSILATQTSTATPLRQVMTASDIFATLDDSAQQCLNLMREKHLRYLPVQGAGTSIALLSFTDLLSETVEHLARIFREIELDQQIVFLQGTYSC